MPCCQDLALAMNWGHCQSASVKSLKVDEVYARALKVTHLACGLAEAVDFGDGRDGTVCKAHRVTVDQCPGPACGKRLGSSNTAEVAKMIIQRSPAQRAA